MKLLISLLPTLLGVFVAVPEAEASVELASLGSPKCDPPGRWRTGRKLNFTESRNRGAVVADNGFSWLTNLDDCANWCCRLPAANCSVAMLEIKSKGANCHLVVCYPTELCVFNFAADFLSYDRTLFVPPATSEATAPAFNFQENTQHKSVIKPRKGVEDLPPESTVSSSSPQQVATSSTRPTGPIRPSDNGADNDDNNNNNNNSNNNNSDDNDASPPKAKAKISVAIIFLYSAIILAMMGLAAFFGQKFLDCWERRHYTRADYLLDGMYEPKATSCS